MRRSELVAYLVGTAVAGTLLVFPYLLRPLVAAIVPGFAAVQVPFFLLPIVWGVWNALHARLAPAIDIGVWGAVLGLLLGAGLNAFLYARGTWFTAAVVLPVFLTALYLLVWRLVVGPLSAALDV